eukprot:589536-Pyramimonas_sp.AAC.3
MTPFRLFNARALVPAVADKVRFSCRAVQVPDGKPMPSDCQAPGARGHLPGPRCSIANNGC